MIPIPGQLIAVLTFPGVIVHEAAHQLFCRFFRVAVLKVCYFRFGNPAGYVLHEPPALPYQQIWIGIGPFLVNTLVGALLAAPAAIPAIQFEAGDPLDYVLLWLGVSIAMHAFPSTGDASSIWQTMKTRKTSLLTKLIATPLVLLIYLGAIGSMVWLDLAYGMLVAMLLPNVLIWLSV
jgi:hypothetical protein